MEKSNIFLCLENVVFHLRVENERIIHRRSSNPTVTTSHARTFDGEKLDSLLLKLVEKNTIYQKEGGNFK